MRQSGFITQVTGIAEQVKNIKVYLHFIFKPFNDWSMRLVLPQGDSKESLFDRMNHWSVRIWFELAISGLIVAPILAYSWGNLPFTGFLIEKTLVVNSTGSQEWAGRRAGMNYSQRVIYVNNYLIEHSSDFRNQIAGYEPGDYMSLQVELPDRVVVEFAEVKLSRFESMDFIQLFWLPYGVAVIYLIIGITIYKIRGNTRSGRAFSYMASVSVIVIGLLFDLSTTHLGSIVWTIAVAQIGSVMIGLALLFPEEIQPVIRLARLRLLTILVSMGLAIWGVFALFQTTNPWAYVPAWRAS